MKTKTLNKFINRLVIKNKFKLLTISFILALAISIFVSFGLVNNRLETASKQIKNTYNAFDFKFVKEPKLNQERLDKAATKYAFNYEVVKNKTFEQIINNSSNAVIEFNSQKSQLASFDVVSNESNLKISKNFITSGVKNKDHEILVTKQLLDVYHKHLSDKITLNNQNYKIVGTFASPLNQKKIKTFITDKVQYVFPLIMSTNDFNKLTAPTKEVVYSKFKNNVDENKRKLIYEDIKKDQLFQKTEKIEKFKITKESITYNPNNLCSDKEEFENYAKLESISKVQFEKIKAVALQAQSGGSCRQTLDSPQIQNLTTANVVNSVNSSNNTSNVQTQTFTPQVYQVSQTVTDEIANVVSKVLTRENGLDKSFSQMFAPQGFSTYDKKAELKRFDNVTNILNELQNGTLPDDLTFSSITVINPDPSKNLTLPLGGGANSISFTNVKTLYAQDKVTFEKEQAQKKQEAAQKNAQIQKDNEKKLKEAADKKAAEQKKDGEKITKTFNIKESAGFNTKNYSLLTSIIDFDALDSSSAINIQIQQQKLLMWLLFSIFIIICSLLVVIVLQKIINENKSELGVLKALGLKSILISRVFLKVPMFAVLIAVIISAGFDYIFVQLLNNFINNSLYLPPNIGLKIDWITICISIIIPLVIIISYVYIYVKALLSVKTLNLLNKIKSNKSYSQFKFLNKLSTNAKLTISTIVNNFSKTLVISTIGVVVTLLISLISLMYFSSVQTFSSIGGELTYDSINVSKKLEASQPSDKLQVYVKNPHITQVLDQNDNIKNFENKRYTISESAPLNLSILATNHLKSEGYDFREYKSSINKGILLPAKFQQLYNIKIGDKFVTIENNKKIYLEIAGFLQHDENIFAYTSTPYLSSKYDELGKANAHIAPSTNDFDDKLDYVVNKNNASLILNKKLNNIIMIVIIISVIIIIIIIPLLFILISNIIDNNISTIATLKALGFNISKIRKMLINPYIVAFIFGQLIAVVINEMYLGPSFASTFFGYLGYDVVFHSQIQGVILTIIIIAIIYQLIIIISSQRINVVKTARILNDDSGIAKISNEDLKNYLKTQITSVIDFDKPQHDFNYKYFKNLTKSEKRKVNKKVWKIYWPKLIGNIFTNASAIPEASLKVVTTVMYKAYIAILYPIMSINNIIKELNIVETLLASSDVYLYQYFKSKKVKEFKEVAYFKLRIHILYAVVKILISVLLADALSMLIGLNTYQKSLLPIVLIGTAISELFSTVLTRGLDFEKYSLNYKPQMYIDIINKVSAIGTTIITIVAFVFIKSDIRIYILIPYLLTIITAFIKFILSMVICSKSEYTNIKIHKMFNKFKTQATNDVVKAALPTIRIHIINIPITLIINIFSARVFNTILATNPDFVIFTAQQGLIQSITTIFDLTSVFETYNALVNQYFAQSKFIKAINLFKYNRKIILKYTPILKSLPYIGSLILLMFFKFDQNTQIYILLSILVEYLSVVLYRFMQVQTDLLSIGGEFKFAAYIGGIIQIITRIMQTVMLSYVGLFNLPIYWLQIIALLQLFVTVTSILYFNKNRIKTGRFLYNLNKKEFISNVKDEFEQFESLKKDWNKQNNN